MTTEIEVKQNEKNESVIITQIVSIAWILTILVSIILYFIQDYYLTLSFFLGAMTSVLSFNILRNNVYKSIISGVGSSQVKTISGYLLRIAIYAFVLYLASLKGDKLNIYLVALGFFTVKIAILIRTFVFRDKY